jgi:pimeloyl-ACP methyl ester carboxylesterase
MVAPGRSTQVTDAPSARLLVLLPGNPGEAGFYDELVDDLAALGHEAVVTSHPALAAPADLVPYAEHHVAHVLHHLATQGRRLADVELVLVGHSVGAYLAYLIVARGLLPVARVVMVFPFLARPTPRGRLILHGVTWQRPFAAFVGLLRALPRRWVRQLVASAGGGVLTDRLLSALATPLPEASAAMAQAERVDIAPRRDVAYLLTHAFFVARERLTVLLCPRDPWVSPTVARQLAPFAQDLPASVTHSLLVDANARRLVAARLHELLRR